ncbi:MAG: ferredoxin [Planctomycetaceae bacterium]
MRFRDSWNKGWGMPTVKFVKEKQSIEVPEGANLRKEALRAGVELYAGPHKVLNCRGLGQCASCQVNICKGEQNVSPQGLFERLRLLLGPLTFFSRLGREDTLRLSCQTRVRGDVEIETHPTFNWHGDKFWG